jgi:hypothetical protein
MGLLAAAAMTTASSSTNAAAATLDYAKCPSVKRYVSPGRVAVFAKLYAYKGAKLQRWVILPVRRYHGANWKEVGTLRSGCWKVLTFKRKDRPRTLCITVKEPFTARNNQPCPRLRRYANGTWEIEFYLDSPGTTGCIVTAGCTPPPPPPPSPGKP